MKKNTVRVALVAGLLAIGVTSFAQTPAQREKIAKHYDLPALKAMAEDFSAKYTENRAKAYQLAAIKGWNVKYTDANGGLHELQGVTEDGIPIYANTFNQGSAVTNGAINLNSGGSLGLDLNGQDMLVGLWDGGHPLTAHIDFAGRVIRTDGTAGTELHPTHVLGTMIGSGLGNVRARGMAYQAIAFVNDWNNDIAEMTDLVAGGLLTSNHSYSFSPVTMPDSYIGTYNSYARSMDLLAAQATYFQPVVAAGNDRGGDKNVSKNGKDLLYSYGTSKNAIVVAAVNEVPDYTGAGSVVMSDFSSWGPTDDFRIKPDISAKGVAVFSTSDASTNRGYTELQGTSMAAPSVTGVIALLQQHYVNLHEADFLKAASIRGLIIHTAKEAGPSEGPDHMFGWGLLNAVGCVEAMTNNEVSSIVSERNLASGQTMTQNLYATGTEPLKVTIAWTDPAGVVSETLDLVTPRLRNDLDIRVTRNGVTYLPWALTKNWNSPSATRRDNDADNVERIDIPTPEEGTYTVTITHKGTSLVGGSQDYSFIVTGINYALAGVDSPLAELFSVWPNPANNELNIVLNAAPQKGDNAKVYDLQGRLMLQSNLSAKDTRLNIANLSSGIYVVSISNGTKTETKKIIVK